MLQRYLKMRLTKKQALKISDLLLTKQGTLRANYKNINNIFNNLFDAEKVYYYSSSYSKGYIFTTDYYDKIAPLLQLLKIDYKIGNDAPRGGKNGDYIQLYRKRNITLNSIVEDVKKTLQ